MCTVRAVAVAAMQEKKQKMDGCLPYHLDVFRISSHFLTLLCLLFFFLTFVSKLNLNQEHHKKHKSKATKTKHNKKYNNAISPLTLLPLSL